MTGTYPIGLFCVTVMLWLVTWWSAHRLLYAFCKRFPVVAIREIPYAFDRRAHPEKAIFFFRRRAGEVLSADPSLWRQRQHFILLAVFSVLVPVLGVVIFGVAAFLEKHR